MQIHFEEKEGDILAFLTGQEDIEGVEYMLKEKRKLFPSDAQDIKLCPLYAALPPHI